MNSWRRPSAILAERRLVWFTREPLGAKSEKRRAILIGRRNWLFCWTEVGAEPAGITRSLTSACRLHGVDPYTYMVDVLQRMGVHPARRVA
ncbi:Transposase [Salinisphaera sp. LB1]|nr:Transposase [Salinisphaera sp. LB1]